MKGSSGRRGRDSAQRDAGTAKLAAIGQHSLLARVWLNMLAVRRQPISEDVSYLLALSTFMLKRIAGALPIASRSPWLTAAMMLITSRPAAELVSRLSA